ncbi:MAG: helix-turn-helix domain-containing protein [Burkholderiaceae bacterium]|nr:helix-turn-helix domain-containing protein [Burkholderiaceae bacterium]MCD8516445.1 helix-turn-helix domain-containing protein [Burkholderiaceae bacterium]MCD8537281.1 helix-turn-helix domain-containing protein [Burkholderiaceae bacterium]MCD8565044.1 helix-turn-helix domain-containing protein [Burkholderiaceae bacterium]
MSLEDPKTMPLKFESPPEPTEPVTALAALRTIRVARGMSLDDVSARLKYPARMIDALESERWDELPKGIGLKTLAKNYTRLLGVDFEALEPVLRQYVPASQGGIANHTSTRAIGESMQEHRSSGSTAWVVLIVLVIAIIVGIAIWQGIVPDSLVPQWLKGASDVS